MAEPAGHADAIRPYQFPRQIVARVVVKALGVPLLSRRFVESRVGEEPQTDDPGRIAVKGSGRNVLAASPDRDPRIFLRILEWIRLAIGLAFVEPQPIAVRIGAGGLLKARLVDKTQIVKPVVPAKFELG